MNLRLFAALCLVLTCSQAFAQSSTRRPSKAELDEAVKEVQAAAAPDKRPPIHDVIQYHATSSERSRWGEGAGPYYPARTQDLGLSGIAVLKCTVTMDGRLNDCTVLAEAPKNAGFGPAALRMAFRGFLTTKPRAEAAEAEDGRIVVPFDWRPPPRY